MTGFVQGGQRGAFDGQTERRQASKVRLKGKVKMKAKVCGKVKVKKEMKVKVKRA